MGKWIAGIVGGVIVGSLLWLLTTNVFPQLFYHRPPPPEDTTRVECTAKPGTVSAGGVAEITVKVSRKDQPLEGAVVRMSIGDGLFASGTRTTSGSTYSGGIFRTLWTAPSNPAAGYVFSADVDVPGMITSENKGHYGTTCEILVRR